MTRESITVLLLDYRSKLLREGLSVFLRRDARFKVIAETSSLITANLAAWAKRPAIIILVDVNQANMPALKQIKENSPSSAMILISSTHPGISSVMTFLLGELNVQGWLTRFSSRCEFVNAIVEVYKGNRYFGMELN